MFRSRLDFVRQQGVAQADLDSDRLYSALMVQPRLVGVVVLTGILLQHQAVFVTLSVVLSWSALMPRHNPVDALYNRLYAHPRHLRRLGVAPSPRRFAQAIAALLACAIATALLLKSTTTAWVLEGILGSGVILVVSGRFCAGSYLYHILWLPTSTKPHHKLPVGGCAHG